MPLQVLRRALQGAKSPLPGGLQQVGLEHLQLGGDYGSRYIQGSLVTSFQLTNLGNGTPFFKIVLQESENSSSRNSSIYILIFGKLAEDCAKVVQQGDTIMVAGFSLAKSTNDPSRHECQLEVSDDAGSTIYVRTGSSKNTTTEQTAYVKVAPKYKYTLLNHLQNETMVNLYGVVKFFKPPYLSKGTDFCTVVSIIDQSNAKLICLFFKTLRGFLPQIYRIGDIVRFHRLKIKEFNNQLQGTAGPGFSSLVFDGNAGTPLIPRTASKGFTFTEEDAKTVQDLRVWVSSSNFSLPPVKKLCDIEPSMFFEFTGQLIGKAKLDGSSYLLKIWDGTRCPFPSLNVLFNEEELEGDGCLLHRLKYLTVDVTAYDNHVHLAKVLKVGQFISVYNVHVKCHSSENGQDVVQFLLHGGTKHGRGMAVLPENHPEIIELKSFLDTMNMALSDNSESASQEPEHSYTLLGSYVERCQQLSVTVLTDHQHLDVTTLNTIRMSNIPQDYRIRARLLKFEPEKLSQSVKLHCPECSSLQEIPDRTGLDSILREASPTVSDSDLKSPSFCSSVVWQAENQGQRRVCHFVTHKELLREAEHTLVFLEGGTLNEILRFTSKFKGIIPVTAKENSLALLDLSVPYFWEGNMQYYGCKHCSEPKALERLRCLASKQYPSWEHTSIAQVFGLLRLRVRNRTSRSTYAFVMKFTLDDGTGTLDVYLVDKLSFQSEIFGGKTGGLIISALFFLPGGHSSKFQLLSLKHHILQANMESIMSRLCPAGKTLDDLPWLECFVKSYFVRDGTEKRPCYQIFDTTVAGDL